MSARVLSKLLTRTRSSMPMCLSQAVVPSGALRPLLQCAMLLQASIRCGYARQIIDNSSYTVFMADIGAQESPIAGEHQKNSIKSVILGRSHWCIVS